MKRFDGNDVIFESTIHTELDSTNWDSRETIAVQEKEDRLLIYLDLTKSQSYHTFWKVAVPFIEGYLEKPNKGTLESRLSYKITSADFVKPYEVEFSNMDSTRKEIKAKMGIGVFTSFIEKAMKKGVIERFEDGTYYAEIPECPGVWATGETEEECLHELQEVLEDWLLFKLKDGDRIPVIDEIDLNWEFKEENQQEE